MTKRERRRLSDDGLPKDAKEFTAEMWMILHRHTEAAKREMREAYERSQRHGQHPDLGDAEADLCVPNS